MNGLPTHEADAMDPRMARFDEQETLFDGQLYFKLTSLE
jgi:hypothetical protein